MKKLLCFILLASGVFIFNSSLINPDKDPETYYYMGEIKAQTPDSVSLGVYLALTKQTVNKKENKMTYQVINIDQKGETKEYNYSFKVKDPDFIMEDSEGNFKGTGKLHGKSWKWTSWKYTVDYLNPKGKMIGKDRITLWGLMVNKDFYGPDGKKLIHYHERHNSITKEMFEILYLQTLKAAGN